MKREIGVEAALGFGDCLFNAPLIRALSTHYECKIGVAVCSHCKDAFYNLPWISEIIEIPNIYHGQKKLKELGYNRTIQITQNVKFFEFQQNNPQHSLADTPLSTGHQLEIPTFDQRPIFIPQDEELSRTTDMLSDKPTIGIEAIYKSAQSWADKRAFEMILDKYLPSHRILWLSNEGAPKHKNVDDLLRFSRREAIMCLRACDTFFSVGSGFFCTSLALPEIHQPKKIVCLWTDNLYHYEAPINKHKWHSNLTWIHNHNELKTVLS